MLAALVRRRSSSEEQPPARLLRLVSSFVAQSCLAYLERAPGRCRLSRGRCQGLSSSLWADPLGEVLLGLDDECRMKRLENPLEALERQL